MPAPVLHSRGPSDPQALKAFVAAAAAGNSAIEHRRLLQPSSSSSAASSASNVRLELDSGVVLTQPNAIARYLGAFCVLLSVESNMKQE